MLALQVEPVHPGDELGSDVVDKVARGKSVSCGGDAFHCVTSGAGPSQRSIQTKLEPLMADGTGTGSGGSDLLWTLHHSPVRLSMGR